MTKEKRYVSTRQGETLVGWYNNRRYCDEFANFLDKFKEEDKLAHLELPLLQGTTYLGGCIKDNVNEATTLAVFSLYAYLNYIDLQQMKKDIEELKQKLA